ncbi:DNA primase [Azospirillum halopraeferens]|uniref:DNA primase n=1 Tax=Azospirillum halopraeferens TaxID=34010 RepID=UPI00040A03B7|nr:DNA primase [Azospirillum halopraeferens]
MAFPPQFLEELRQRLPLSDVIGRRIRLIRAGREFKAPCPFHNEKTPSFYVNDQKGFFHCFGCGAHGDVIGFTMRYDNLAFPEAVESLASLAGLVVPQPTEEERRRYERRKTLHDVMEQACRWFERQLREPAGRAGLSYLQGRGLDADTIARFRLGFAPADGSALRTHLLRERCDEEDLVTVGLLRRPDDGRAPYSFFRNRVMFPVTDRRGQVIAFGGRILEGDGPKYVNTADTPLFHKGTLLYGLSRARQAAADGKPVVVAEGYMDVIALVCAGFEGAVAPLGTALTETQVQELWRLIPDGEKEPYLCFDGDNAGRRAAWKAVERILPHLAPGHSARVAFLPEGEDPDSLIRSHGARAMQGVLDAAIPLAEAVWRMESEGRRSDTPEAKAAVKAALEARCDSIADRTVQSFYRTEMRRRVDAAFGWAARGPAGPPFRPRWPGATRAPRRHVPGEPGLRTSPPPDFRRSSPRRLSQDMAREKILLATVINHPELFDEVGEALALLPFPPGPLEDLRQALIDTLGSESRYDSGLDAAAVHSHLSSAGFDTILASLLSGSTYVHGRFARPDTSAEDARKGWWPTWRHLHHRRVLAELREAEESLARAFSEERHARVVALREEILRTAAGIGDDGDDAGPDDGGMEEAVR